MLRLHLWPERLKLRPIGSPQVFLARLLPGYVHVSHGTSKGLGKARIALHDGPIILTCASHALSRYASPEGILHRSTGARDRLSRLPFHLGDHFRREAALRGIVNHRLQGGTNPFGGGGSLHRLFLALATSYPKE